MNPLHNIPAALLATALACLSMGASNAARAQFSGPPFLGVPLMDMRLSVTSTADGMQLQWINAKPSLQATYQVYRNTGSGLAPLAATTAMHYSDHPGGLPRMTVTYEIEAHWSNGSIAVSGPVSATTPNMPPVVMGPGPIEPGKRCFGRPDLTGVNISKTRNPNPNASYPVFLDVDFPSATPLGGGAKLIVKDTQTQAVTTYPMGYGPNYSIANGVYAPGYQYLLPLGMSGTVAKLGYDLTVEAVNADCSFHSFTAHWEINGFL